MTEQTETDPHPCAMPKATDERVREILNDPLERPEVRRLAQEVADARSALRLHEACDRRDRLTRVRRE